MLKFSIDSALNCCKSRTSMHQARKVHVRPAIGLWPEITKTGEGPASKARDLIFDDRREGRTGWHSTACHSPAMLALARVGRKMHIYTSHLHPRCPQDDFFAKIKRVIYQKECLGESKDANAESVADTPQRSRRRCRTRRIAPWRS